MKTFAFALGQRVTLKTGREEEAGTIVGRGEFTHSSFLSEEYLVAWDDFPENSEWREFADLVAVPDEASHE